LRRLIGVADGEIDGEVFLDRHLAGERRLLGQVGDAEAAGPQDPIDTVVLGEVCADRQGGEIGHGGLGGSLDRKLGASERRGARMRPLERGPKRTFDPARPVPDAALTDPRPPRLSANGMATEFLPELATVQRRFAGNNMAEERDHRSSIRRNGSCLLMRYMNRWFSIG
jgi:hypothetical protein